MMSRIKQLMMPALAAALTASCAGPEERTVQVLLLQNGLLLPHELYGAQDVAKVNILDGCFIELNKVFGA